MSKEMKKYQQRIIGRVKKLSKKDYAALQDFMETSAARIVRGVLGEELFDGMDVDQYRKGGIVKKSEGGKVQKTGFVEGSPDNYAKGDTVADTVKTQVREGSFVLNAPTVEKLQQAGMLPKGVDNSDKNATIKANKGGLMDVALSKGEYVIEPEEAQRIGYSFLEKINDQGKAEVDRRQAAADGGFINGYQEGGKALPAVLPQSKPTIEERDVEGPFTGNIPLSPELKSKYQTFLKSKRRRKDVEDLIDSMSDQERLFTVGLAETSASADSVESMMGVMQTVVNRAKTNRKRFEDVNNIADVLKHRSSRGTGTKMFQYDGLDPTLLGTRIQEVVDGKSPKGVTKLNIASDNVLNPEYEANLPLPFDVMYYTKPDAPMAPRFENNPETRYVTSFGGHDYYALEAAPESPDQQRVYDKMIREGKI